MYISQASNLASNPNQSGSEVVVDARAQTLATAGTLCTKDTEPRMMSSVAERRLRPLWDAIDSRHYKSALKLASSLLAKHPDSVYLLVLKALVLERMEKPEEALTLCEQAKALEPTDDLTLSTLQIVFQRLGRPEQATACYEKACSKTPNNMDLMMGLFNCYVRDYSFLKQQQIAMKMYKLFGEERFLLWAICSIQLQVYCGNGDKTLLSLGEALLKKRLDTHGFEELEALLVYSALLEYEGKYVSAIDILSNKSGELFSIVNDKLKLKGKLLLLSHQYNLAANVFQELLETSSDDWVAFMLYLDATLEATDYDLSQSDIPVDHANTQIFEAVTRLPYEEAESRLKDASVFLQRLQNKDNNELRRGPFIGNIEIEKRRFLLQFGQGNSNTTCSSICTAIVGYFERFGHMVSFTSDIKLYLEFVQRYGSVDLVENLYKAYSKAENENSLHLLRKKLSLCQVEMQLGSMAGTSNRDLLAKAIDIANLYVTGLKLSKDLDPQECMHGEEFIPIVVYILIQLFLRTKDPGYVIESILILEFGLAMRKFSSQCKIMLTSLYSTLFCSSTAFAWYKMLDIKNILIETMSHHMLTSLVKSTQWSQLDLMLKDIVKFHEDYVKEAADLVILAYRHCNYSKVLEFVQFKDRLQHSHNLLLAKVEDAVLQLKLKAHNPDEIMVVFEKLRYGVESLNCGMDEKLATLSFNEALDTRPWWSPSPHECSLIGTANGESALHKTETETHEKWRNELRKRSLLPRLIYLSMGAVRFRESGRENGDAAACLNELKDLVAKYGILLGISWEKLPDISADISSLRSHTTEFNLDATEVFSLFLFWVAYEIASQGSTKPLLCLNEFAKYLISELTNFVRASNLEDDEQFSEVDMVASWSSFPSLISVVTEGFSWYVLCLHSWIRGLQPTSKAGKKKKKGSTAQVIGDASADSNLLTALHRCTEEFCIELEKLMSWTRLLSGALNVKNESVYVDLLANGKEMSIVDNNFVKPGLVLHALVVSGSSSSVNEMGERITSIFQNWQPEVTFKTIMEGQCDALHDLTSMISSRINTLRGVMR